MQYLEDASAQTGIPGVVPTVWPITRFEQAFALYFLLLNGLLDHHGLRDVVQQQLDSLERALRPGGLGMSDYFMPDGDDTAVAIAVLQAAGRRVPLAALEGFAQGNGFCAFPGELQSAVSVTAHAIHALALARPGQTCADALLELQHPDGRWLGDKWNQSWLYTTSQVLAVLDERHAAAIRNAVNMVLAYQHPDGGWGMQRSTPEETAYGILALHAGLPYGGVAAHAALARGVAWLSAAYRPFERDIPPLWMGKELYSPRRLVHIIILSVLAHTESEPL